jgi:hypothetical protein
VCCVLRGQKGSRCGNCSLRVRTVYLSYVLLYLLPFTCHQGGNLFSCAFTAPSNGNCYLCPSTVNRRTATPRRIPGIRQKRWEIRPGAFSPPGRRYDAKIWSVIVVVLFPGRPHVVVREKVHVLSCAVLPKTRGIIVRVKKIR